MVMITPSNRIILLYDLISFILYVIRFPPITETKKNNAGGNRITWKNIIFSTVPWPIRSARVLASLSAPSAPYGRFGRMRGA